MVKRLTKNLTILIPFNPGTANMPYDRNAYMPSANVAPANMPSANVAPANMPSANVAPANMPSANVAPANMPCVNVAPANRPHVAVKNSSIAKNSSITKSYGIAKNSGIVKNAGNVKKIRSNSAFVSDQKIDIDQEIVRKIAQEKNTTRVNKFLDNMKIKIEQNMTNCTKLKNIINKQLEQKNIRSLDFKLKLAKTQATTLVSQLHATNCILRNEKTFQPHANIFCDMFAPAINEGNNLKKIINCAFQEVNKLIKLYKLKKISNGSENINNIQDQVQTYTNNVINQLLVLLKCLYEKIREYPLTLEQTEALSSELASLFDNAVSMTTEVDNTVSMTTEVDNTVSMTTEFDLVSNFDLFNLRPIPSAVSMTTEFDLISNFDLFNLGPLPSIDEDK
jgi:hypothetical protein